MDKLDQDKIHFSTDRVIVNRLMDQPGHIKNFVCLVTKQFIYRQ